MVKLVGVRAAGVPCHTRPATLSEAYDDCWGNVALVDAARPPGSSTAAASTAAAGAEQCQDRMITAEKDMRRALPQQKEALPPSPAAYPTCGLIVLQRARACWSTLLLMYMSDEAGKNGWNEESNLLGFLLSDSILLNIC